jgi:hypothetical protein
MHARCLTWLQRAKAGEVECIVVSHTLAETYAVLTTLPVKPRISPLVAQKLIDNNLQTVARIVLLTTADYWNTIQRMAGDSQGALFMTPSSPPQLGGSLAVASARSRQ